MSYKYIYNEVERVVLRYGTRDLMSLIKLSGIILRYSSKYSSLKGYYFHVNRCDFIIVNSKLPKQEKRIVIAHEFAHFVLHKELAKDAPIHDLAMFTVRYRPEYEANLFCAELLLTDDDVLFAAKETEDDFYAMASTLSVMPELLLFKLYGMIERGYEYKLPIALDSAFLKGQ